MKRTWFASIFFIAGMLGFWACGDSSSSSSSSGSSDDEEQVLISTTVKKDGDDMLKFGHLNLDVPADTFLASFELGDVVTVMIDGFDTLDAPVVSDYDDVAPGEFLLRVKAGKPHLTFAINFGQVAVSLGIAESAPEGSENAYKLKDVKFPIKVVIAMKEAGGFKENLEMLEYQNYGLVMENYPDLSVADFANFREISTTGMGKGVLFRSSSPIDPVDGRNTYADSLAKAAKVATFINLTDTEAGAEAYEGFDESYYATQKVVYLSLPASFTTKLFREGLVKGLRFMLENDAPYLVHCQMGKDRAGFVSAVLEALMGASSKEVKKDYVKTYDNYYNVVDGKQQRLTESQLDWFQALIVRNMKMAYGDAGVDIDDFEKVDLAKATEQYLEKLGLSKKEIAALKDRLK
jgi:hypothetical protein